MRFPSVLTGLAVVSACSGQAQPQASGAAAGAPGTSTAIFREISIEPHGTIALASPFAQRATVARAISPETFLLVGDGRVTYGGTDSLLIEVDPDNRVRAMQFVYPAAFDFAASVAEYTNTLGAPSERTNVDSAGGRLARVAWSDVRTRFTLSRFVRDGASPRTWSVLQSATNER